MRTDRDSKTSTVRTAIQEVVKGYSQITTHVEVEKIKRPGTFSSGKTKSLWESWASACSKNGAPYGAEELKKRG